jgi:hypothetical protein
MKSTAGITFLLAPPDSKGVWNVDDSLGESDRRHQSVVVTHESQIITCLFPETELRLDHLARSDSMWQYGNVRRFVRQWTGIGIDRGG